MPQRKNVTKTHVNKKTLILKFSYRKLGDLWMQIQKKTNHHWKLEKDAFDSYSNNKWTAKTADVVKEETQGSIWHTNKLLLILSGTHLTNNLIESLPHD